MKLYSRILLRIVLPLFVLISAWAALFYFSMIDEVNDETDDSLEMYSENLIRRHLDGRLLPASDNGTNNTFFIERIDADEVFYDVRFDDETVWLDSKNEFEPARVMRTTFIDNSGECYRLTVMTPTIEKEDIRESILIWAVALYILLIAIIAVVVSLVLRRNLKPLYRLLEWLDGVEVGSVSSPPDNPTKVYEFARLNEAAAGYVRRSREVLEQQKEFIADASHEIQTPLAICSSRLDMLADTPLTEAQLGEVLKTQQTIGQISRLNRALLLLAKIDSGQFAETEQVGMCEIVESRLDDFKEIYSSRSLDVEMVVHGDFHVQADRSLAVAMVTNLLKNAFVHNIEGGRIAIEITPDSLTIRNTGRDEPLDRQKVFTRFYQARKTEGSTGLGLAIVAAVADRYSLKASYRFVDGLHCFSVERGL